MPYDLHGMRTFLGIDPGVESVPDATALLQFRYLLEAQALTERIFETINAQLRERKRMLSKGTMVDATILAPPSSTKNRAHARYIERYQSKKGKLWYFGMKASIGSDADSGMVRGLSCTGANVADSAETEHLLHGQETVVLDDAGYAAVDKRAELRERFIA